MPFPEDVVEMVFARSNGRCECYRQHLLHDGKRCGSSFESDGDWVASYKTPESAGGPSIMSNCEALCATCSEQSS